MPRNAPNKRPKEPEVITIYCDGASLGNPGSAGAGFLLLGPDGKVLRRRAVPLGETTNNVAEYRALIAALHEAAAVGARKVRVRADSELLVKQMRGEYRVTAPHLKPLYAWAQKLL
ncbi:MAG: ribonuclease HI family protein, partial [Armatimonadetes bacterium]|nr:ribonuclease HI family protein [Armatimonadota bacterium]